MQNGVRSLSSPPGKNVFSMTATLVLIPLLDVTHASPSEFEVFISLGKAHKNTKMV